MPKLNLSRGKKVMNKEQTLKAIEAVIFASGDPISIERLSNVFEISPEQVEKYCASLKEKLEAQNGALKLLKLENTYQLATDETYAPYIKKAFDIKRHTPLSPAALEVLAVISYNQPVTRAFVEQVRGVDCSGVITTLVEKELIEECGRLDLPGKPLLYGTTKNFLRCFKIGDLSELPPLPKNDTEINDVGEQLEIEENISENGEEEQ